jgi:glycosyltransferase involved in cell wall biosynthesis
MLLTIGIPVYNGEKYIEQTILSILNANFNWNLVEIIVSDNNSTDRTCSLVEKYSKINLFKHNSNVGFDRNVDQIFKYAKGRYVWTIGADDVIINTDVSEINNVISDSNIYSVIFAGESLYNCSGIITSAEDFLFKSNFRSGFISNNIINKDLWLSTNTSEFIDSGWIHFGMILKLLKLNSSYILNKKYVDEIEETKFNKSWIQNGQGLLIGLNLVHIFDRVETWGYNKQMKKRLKLVIKGAYPKFIIYSKCLGLKINFSILKKFILLYFNFFSFWLIDLPILLLPKFFFKIPYSIYKKLK